MPLVRPVTTTGLVAFVPVIPPGLEVAIYPVMASPPVLPGAVKVMLACALPAVAVPMVGADGVVAGTMADDAALYAESPMALVALA